MLTIDGSFGEGGGQILRSSLSLSLVTGRPVRLVNVRAGRPRPGLGRQHLTAVRAAAEVGEARVEGAAPGSQRLLFAPRRLRPGSYAFSTGGAGSTTLVLQTVLLPLLTADAPSKLTLEGGTHNPFAPPFDFLERVYLPLLARMGARVTLALERPGFYPAGGGRIRAEIAPVRELSPLELEERGEVRRRAVRALVSALPRHIGQREVETAGEALGIPPEAREVVEVPEPAGPGNVVIVEIESDRVTELFTGFGRRGVPAEAVAEEVAGQARRYLEAGVPVGPHLADQLLLPLALAGGGVFTTLRPSRHTKTNAEVVQHFLEADLALERLEGEAWRVSVARR